MAGYGAFLSDEIRDRFLKTIAGLASSYHKTFSLVSNLRPFCQGAIELSNYEAIRRSLRLRDHPGRMQSGIRYVEGDLLIFG